MARISQPDRLLMGTLGNLEGLKRRFPSFKGVDPERIQEAVRLLDQLSMKLEAMLGKTSGNATPEELQRAARDESDTRAAGQEARESRCPPNAD